MAIQYKKIGFVCYAVTNMRRARKFYEGVLGLEVARTFSPNFVEYDLGPDTLAVGCSPRQWQPSRKGTTAALEVKDFAAAVAQLKKKRAKISIGPIENPGCWMVGVRDPDGNQIILHHRK